MRKHRFFAAVVGMATAVGVGVVAAPAASAEDERRPWRGQVLTRDVIAPFQLAVNSRGVYIADGFTNTLSILKPSGKKQVLVRGDDGGAVNGVAVSRDDTALAYTQRNFEAGTATLTIRTAGQPRRTVDLQTYEERANPDRGVTYGVIAGGNPCARKFFRQVSGGPATYKGIVDSNPYAVARWGGSWVVADAGGNTLLKVGPKGGISTLAVLPRQPVTFTAEQVAALGAPRCVVGVTYAFESVPTDVEVAENGDLLVSTLPGGPESPALGARGSVYRVDARTGAARLLATGFLGATNVAERDGTVFVAELFGGRINKVYRGGAVRLFRNVMAPLSLEVRGDTLYAGTLADIDFETGEVRAPGTVISYRLAR